MVPRKFDLEERLIQYSSRVIKLVESMPSAKAASHIAGQMLRSGIAPALLYGEAQGAESRDDFIHKMKIGLKELKETRVCLKLACANGMINGDDNIVRENEELIAIFARSIETAKRNNNAKL